jgi:hypothetical protein
LVRPQFQPNSALFVSNRIFNLPVPRDIQGKAAALGHFPYLIVVGEADRSREECFPILFQKLTEPALSENEVHINVLLATTSAAVTQMLATAMRKRQRSLAVAANFACISLPAPTTPVPLPCGYSSRDIRVLFA